MPDFDMPEQNAAPTYIELQAAVQAEREACAARCDALKTFGDNFPGTGNNIAWARAAESLADSIRARSYLDSTTALADMLAKAREDALREALNLIGKEAMAPHNDSLQHLRMAVTAIIPTPSPERGDAQQGGGNVDR